MTSNKAAGYSALSNKGAFDPLKDGDIHTYRLAGKDEAGPEYIARKMEKEVNDMVHQSAILFHKREMTAALDKIKDAQKRERILQKHREKHGLLEQQNVDLTYAVQFTLANQQEKNGMLGEALNTYSVIVRNKQYPQAGKLRVNMGNIYFQQKKYPAAIKMYRMAMDQISGASKELRNKMQRNIGNAFVKLAKYAEAIQAYEQIMDSCPDAQTGLNLILCYYALGDNDKLRKGFMQLLCVDILDEDHDQDDNQNKDPLTRYLDKKRAGYGKYIQKAAQLLAPRLGYDWMLEHLRAPQTGALGGNNTKMLMKIAMEMEIVKGLAYLKDKKSEEAINVLKEFEKNAVGLVDKAASNLSFVYFLEGDYTSASRYAEKAVNADRYNATALVNKANCLFIMGEHERAKEMYLEAIGVEADCTEAIYNLGLVCKRMGSPKDALQAFKKLHRIISKDPQVIYQIADLFLMMNDIDQALEWFKILHGCVPTDPTILARLGSIYRKKQDETQAFHNYLDSYRYFPVNMEIISWLGVWYVNSELYEHAIQFFTRAAQIEPSEVKWRLMIASCYRRMRNFHEAIRIYQDIHEVDPDNVKCLEYLSMICKEVNHRDYEMYANKIRAMKNKTAVRQKELENEVPQGREPQRQQEASPKKDLPRSATEEPNDDWGDDDVDLPGA